VSRISATTARLVRQRAAARCEYCHFPEAHAALPFQIDHIIARQHGGRNDPANLALACQLDLFTVPLHTPALRGNRWELGIPKPCSPSK
jgi:hypothetical protein